MTRLDYALRIGKKSLIEPLSMRYRILTYIQQAERASGQMRGQMVIGNFMRHRELLDAVASSAAFAGQSLAKLLFVNRVAIQPAYLMHIKRQHGPSGVKADQGVVQPEIVLSAVDAANHGAWASELRVSPNGNPLTSTVLEVGGVLYRFVWEVKPGSRSLTLFSLYPIRSVK